MTHDKRNPTLAKLRATATRVFAHYPAYQSLLFSVSQYWNDQADDECHAHLIASTRAVPIWPHSCDDFAAEVWDDERAEMVPNPDQRTGEKCSSCDYDSLKTPWLEPPAWEPYCHEHASQDTDTPEAYMPFAILRRDGGTELVGRLQRPYAELIEGEPDGEPFTGPARELFDVVCAHPDDDGPRHVLADHLQEQRDPRGEYIALALANAAPERAAELLAAHGRAWLAPLGAVIPADCARYERGFVAHVDVYAGEHAPAGSTWGTVETIRFLPGSEDVLLPEMTALREVGPVGEAGLAAIVRADRPWRIETLHAAGNVAALVDATNLPRLRHVITDSFDGVQSARLSQAQLERITLLVTDHGDVARWVDLRRTCEPLRWFAVAEIGENGEPAGWQLAFGPDRAVEISVPGWHPRTRLDRLATLVGELPLGMTIRLVDSRYRVFTDDDRRELADLSGRPIVT